MGTRVYTDGAARKDGFACYAYIVFCDGHFITQEVDYRWNSIATAMETMAVRTAIAYLHRNRERLSPPFEIFTDLTLNVELYLGKVQDKNGLWKGTKALGKELGVSVSYISAHAREHNGNKACDLLCRSLCGIALHRGDEVLSRLTGKT